MSYVHKQVEALFQILGLVEVWTRRSMELSPFKHLQLQAEQQQKSNSRYHSKV
jgi:hypothetical protein